MKNFKLNINKNILMIVSAITSLLMFIPIGLYIPKIQFALGMLTETEPSAVEKVLSFPVTDPSLLVPLIFFLMMLLSQMIIGAYLIIKAETKQEKVMGYLTSILGGFGAPSIYLLVSWLRKNSEKLEVRPTKKFVKVGVLVASPLILITPVIGLLAYKGIDTATNVKQVAFSLDETKPNVIEIFSDGLDYKLMEKNWGTDFYKDFEDFKIYPKTVTTGAETSYSFPTIMRGLTDGNYFKTRDDSGEESREALYASIFGTAIADHLNKTPFAGNKNSYSINTSGVNKEAEGYAPSVSGEPAFLKEVFNAKDKTGKALYPNVKDTQIVNYAQAVKDVAGKFGVSNFSQDVALYKWLEQKAVVDNSTAARLFMQEFVTHAPRVTSPSGSWSSSTDDPINDSYNGLHKTWVDFFDKLKNIKDAQGHNVYDNSMIIIYGDHSNHSRPLAHKSNNINSYKWNTVSMVKYPRKVTPGQEVKRTTYAPVTNRSVYTPFVNRILENFEANWATNPDSVRNFIDTNDNFKLDRKFLGFFGGEAHYMKFDPARNNELWTDKTMTAPFNNTGWLTYDEYHSKLVPSGTEQDRQDALIQGLNWQGGIN